MLALSLLALALGGSAAQAAEHERPSFVVILVDDLGYMDVGANNPESFYRTPNIDRLAASGLRFTDGYAANPVCSPSRYALQTGRHPTRAVATNWFSGRNVKRFAGAEFVDRMALEELTVAEVLTEAGYRTAFLGKWHLGPGEEYWPEAQGYQVNVGGHSKGHPPSYFSPYRNPRLEDGPEGEHLTARLTDETIALLRQWREQPFFLFLSYYTVHTPLQAPAELVQENRARAAEVQGEEFASEEQVWLTDKPRRVRILQKHPTYAAMVESLDRGVGRILDELEALGLAENTVVIFTSDNGGLSTSEGSPTSNLPLRGGKGWLYEGGIREPFLVRWPGVTEPGATSAVPVIGMDLFPTVLEMAGLVAQPEQHLDGLSLAPLLRGDGELAREHLFWHYPHYSNQGGFPGAAVRAGRWKLIERFEDGRVQLFDLATDPGERIDAAAQHPQRVELLRARLHAWYGEVDARFLRARDGGPEPWRPVPPETGD